MAYVTSIKNGLEVKFSLFILAGNLMCGKKYAQKVFSPEPKVCGFAWLEKSLDAVVRRSMKERPNVFENRGFHHVNRALHPSLS